MDDSAIGSDDHTAAAKGRDDLVDEAMPGRKLLMPPAIAKGGPEFLEPMEEVEEFFVAEGSSGNTFIEKEDADKSVPLHNWDRNGAAENLKFAHDLAAGERFVACAAQDAAVAVKVRPEAAG